MLTPVNLSAVKRGDFFHLRDDESSPLWIRDYYERSSRNYCIVSYDDANRFLLRKGSVIVYVDIVDDLPF